MQLALACWADAFGARIGAPRVRPAPTVWCSWYHYFTEVAEPDILDNLAAIDELDLAIDVVQIDDGYQSEVGDWLSWSDRFGSLGDVVQRIRDRGRRAGIWVAPFVAGARSELAHEHPEWLIGEASVAQNWDQDVFGIDLTHPGARRYLTEVFGTMRGLGIDYFKIDFLYGGALIGRRYADAAPLDAYRSGLELIRSAIGQDAYLLGCGAPMLPSVGLVDAMRISPDCAPHYEPDAGDMSQQSIRAALMTGAARAFMHGRFWVNDPDCLIVRPGVERREQWAAHIERYGGLVASSDRLRDLDEWGLATTRRLLQATPRERFV